MVAVDGTSLVDFRGMPVDKYRTGGWLAAGLMLGTELSERICVMGIAMNLVTYLVGDLHLSAARSANTVTNFMGTLNLLGLLGGFLADARLGRYLTVAISATIAALGVTLLTAATTIPSMRPPPCENSRTQQCVAANGHQLALLYAALYTIALGGGGIKANVSGFGTDQFDSSDPKEGKKMIVFFNRFYFCISLGSLFAVTVLVYIQDNVGRGWGYGISAATMIMAVAIFLLGSPIYRFRRPEGSPLSVIWRVGFLAWKKRRVPYPSQNQLLNGYSNATVAHTHKLRCLDKAAIIEEIDDKCNYNCSTVTEVEEVKMVMMLLPIWCTCILFWTIYSQMNTFTIEQATLMNRKIGTFEVPAGSFSFFLFITILVFTFLNERILLPIFRKINGGITCLRCIGIGLIFSVAGMVVAAVVEVRRRGAFANGNVRITAFWLVPQFFLVGAGEAFAYVGQLQFFITEAPQRMKSMSTGLFLATLSMGYFMSSLLVSIVEAATSGRWLRSNLNAARLENFYGMLSVLGVVNFMAFLVFATKHQYKIKSTDHQNAIENA